MRSGPPPSPDLSRPRYPRCWAGRPHIGLHIRPERPVIGLASTETLTKQWGLTSRALTRPVPHPGPAERPVYGRGPASRPWLSPVLPASIRCRSLALRTGSARLAGMATGKEPPLITDEATWRKVQRRRSRQTLPLPPFPASRTQRLRRLLATVVGVCVLSAVVGLLMLTSGPP